MSATEMPARSKRRVLSRIRRAIALVEEADLTCHVVAGWPEDHADREGLNSVIVQLGSLAIDFQPSAAGVEAK